MPEEVIGTCPWCGRDETSLYLVMGYSQVDNGCVAQYVCGRCKSNADRWKHDLPMENIQILAVRED